MRLPVTITTVLSAALIMATQPPMFAAEVDGFERFTIADHTQEASQNSYPCLARLEDGRLFVVWVAARPGNGDRGAIVGAFSNDHGRTWSKPVEILPGESELDPSIIVTGERILVTSTVQDGPGISTSITRCSRSEDNGKTWGKPYEIPMNHRYTAGKIHRGLKLKSGVLLMGYSWDVICESGKMLGSEGEMRLRTGMMISRDNGLTWTNGEDFDVDCEVVSKWAIHGCAEPAIVELDDGSVYMLVRTGADYLYQARSTDEGKTWTDIGPSPLKGHNAPAALCKFQAGQRRGILCVWDNARERYPLCATASFDGGKTWSKPKDIAGATGGQQAAYPSCEQAADGTLVAVWFQDVSGGRDINCARFTADWLLEDK